MLVESLQETYYAPASEISNDYCHVYDFFNQLKKEHVDQSIRILIKKWLLEEGKA